MQAVLRSTTVAQQSTSPQPVARNVAVDVYRGFVMLLMMAEVLQLSRVAAAFPGNWFWGFLGWNQTHVAWAGCSLHDTIQPGFSFLVGVALPYSIASRLAKGGTFHAYDPAKDEWRELPGRVPFPKYGGHSVSAVAMRDEGVVMFFSSRPQGMKAVLYKHTGR